MPETTVNEWDAERIAELRCICGAVGSVHKMFTRDVLSLLDALEEARCERDALSADYETLRGETEKEIRDARRDAEEAREQAETLREDLRRMVRLHVERDNALALRRF